MTRLRLIVTGGNASANTKKFDPLVQREIFKTLALLHERFGLDSLISVRNRLNIAEEVERWSLLRNVPVYQVVVDSRLGSFATEDAVVKAVKTYSANFALIFGKCASNNRPDAPTRAALAASRMGLPVYQLYMTRGHGARKSIPRWRQIVTDNGVASLVESPL